MTPEEQKRLANVLAEVGELINEIQFTSKYLSDVVAIVADVQKHLQEMVK